MQQQRRREVVVYEKTKCDGRPKPKGQARARIKSGTCKGGIKVIWYYLDIDALIPWPVGMI